MIFLNRECLAFRKVNYFAQSHTVSTRHLDPGFSESKTKAKAKKTKPRTLFSMYYLSG